MYGSPIRTLRASLRARWVKIRGAVAWTNRSAHAAREADALALDVGAGAAEDLGRLGEVDDLDPDLLEEGVGVGLDLLEAFGRDDLDRGQLAGQVGQGVHGPGQALALARGPTAADRRMFEVLGSHLVTSGACAPLRSTSCDAMVRRAVQRRSASSRPSKKARLARRGATLSPMWWNAIPRVRSSSASAGLRDRGLGDHEGVGLDRRRLPGQDRPDLGAPGAPRRGHRPT